MSLLEVKGLTAGYGSVPVVRDVGLSVERGELVALLGANGAGKTTTLLAISGLVRTYQGEIRLDGRPVGGLPPAHRARAGIQHVPEDRSLFPSLTVDETLGLAAGGRRSAEWVLEYFPALRGLGGRRVAALSGGEQQMLALARALCRDPSLLIVDEMSLGLAPLVVSAFFPVLRRVAAERGCGVVIVEQHVHLALRWVDRVHVMAGGRVVASGTTGEMRPRIDELTSAYLGEDPAPAPGVAGGSAAATVTDEGENDEGVRRP
ncbi:ABC transporter ATP-binding protein [Sphaerisporangium krabiense]|uniref:Branched-chain amino acid transport system ATP-binding protein n=1 Tax=Sphaerisporangium krabiense TaxID=763782 RepID=A0A7W8Z258_9ACTN|nr:ABC transporter ATP-binding protein [Sphaerisporangium krabiense]MBB5626054.1 branched-chain amino acid transport system ATP-binding protein [Sphaerisporangium krabiense]GII64859.1 ABC transporter ATP-binding protein [Sphaerisporangium krabiense]